jgi:hypothetical protein
LFAYHLVPSRRQATHVFTWVDSQTRQTGLKACFFPPQGGLQDIWAGERKSLISVLKILRAPSHPSLVWVEKLQERKHIRNHFSNNVGCYRLNNEVFKD